RQAALAVPPGLHRGRARADAGRRVARGDRRGETAVARPDPFGVAAHPPRLSDSPPLTLPPRVRARAGPRAGSLRGRGRPSRQPAQAQGELYLQGPAGVLPGVAEEPADALQALGHGVDVAVAAVLGAGGAVSAGG